MPRTAATSSGMIPVFCNCELNHTTSSTIANSPSVEPEPSRSNPTRKAPGRVKPELSANTAMPQATAGMSTRNIPFTKRITPKESRTSMR